MMLTGLQTSSKTLPLDGTLGKSQSLDSDTVQPVSFGEVLKLKEKQLQHEQEVNPASVAAALAALQTMSLATPLPLPQFENLEANETTTAKAESNKSALDVVPQASTPSTEISDYDALSPLTARLTATKLVDPVAQTLSNADSASLAQAEASETAVSQPQLFQTESVNTQSSSAVTSTKVESVAFTTQNFVATATKLAPTIKQDISSTSPLSQVVTAGSAAQAEPTQPQALRFKSVKAQASAEISSPKADATGDQTVLANVVNAEPAIRQDSTSAMTALEAAKPPAINPSNNFFTATTPQGTTPSPTTSNASVVEEQQPSITETLTDSQHFSPSVSVFAPQEKSAEAINQNSVIEAQPANVVIETENKNAPSPLSLTNENTAAPAQDSTIQVSTHQPIPQQFDSVNVDTTQQPAAQASTTTSFAPTTNQAQPKVAQPASETSLAQNVIEETDSPSENVFLNVPSQQNIFSASRPQIITQATELPEKVEVPSNEITQLVQEFSTDRETDATPHHVQAATMTSDESEIKPARIQATQMSVAKLTINEADFDDSVQTTSTPTLNATLPISSTTTAEETLIAQSEIFGEVTDQKPSTIANSRLTIPQDAKPVEIAAQPSLSQPTAAVTTNKAASQTLEQPELINTDLSHSSMPESATQPQDLTVEAKPVEIKPNVPAPSLSTSEATISQQVNAPSSDQIAIVDPLNNSDKPITSQSVNTERPVLYNTSQGAVSVPETKAKTEAALLNADAVAKFFTAQPAENVTAENIAPTQSVAQEILTEETNPLPGDSPTVSFELDEPLVATLRANGNAQPKDTSQVVATPTTVESSTMEQNAMPVAVSDLPAETVSQPQVSPMPERDQVAEQVEPKPAMGDAMLPVSSDESVSSFMNIPEKTTVASDAEPTVAQTIPEQEGVHQTVSSDLKLSASDVTSTSAKAEAVFDLDQTAEKSLKEQGSIQHPAGDDANHPAQNTIIDSEEAIA